MEKKFQCFYGKLNTSILEHPSALGILKTHNMRDILHLENGIQQSNNTPFGVTLCQGMNLAITKSKCFHIRWSQDISTAYKVKYMQEA